MKNLKYQNLVATAVSAVALGLFMVGCGGGSSAPGPINNPDNSNPGIVGAENIEVGLAQPGLSEGSVPGASEYAPLGVNTAYNPSVAGVQTSKSLSKSVSELAPGQDLVITRATIGPFNVDPDYNSENIVVTEGDLVTLWVEYEVSGQAPGVSVSWFSGETEIDYSAPFIGTEGAGIFETRFTATVPVGSAGPASYDFDLNYGRDISVVAGPGVEAPETINVPFTIEPNNPTTEEEFEPPTSGEDPECLSHNSVVWSSDDTSVTVTSDKELSNVQLQFEDWSEQKFDDLDEDPRYTDTFAGTGDNAGKKLRGVWIKAGCNGTGGGKGIYLGNSITGHSLMVWEDLIQNSDYDYNDFVSSMNIREIRNADNNLIEIDFVIKALARGAGYDHSWQFNIDSAFPGATCVATIDQYYASGNRHGPQRIWYSNEGVSIPVFLSSKQALPAPPGYWATNAFDAQPVVNGDYAIVKVQFDTPMVPGTYTPMPYAPELRVKPSNGNTYIVPLWTRPGDYVDSNGYPLAFIVPNTYAWPAEGVRLWDVYDGFFEFADYANETAPMPSTLFWNTPSVGDHYDQSQQLIDSVEFIEE